MFLCSTGHFPEDVEEFRIHKLGDRFVPCKQHGTVTPEPQVTRNRLTVSWGPTLARATLASVLFILRALVVRLPTHLI